MGVDPTDTVLYNGTLVPIDGRDAWPLLLHEGVTDPREWLPVTEATLINTRTNYKLVVSAHSVGWNYKNCTGSAKPMGKTCQFAEDNSAQLPFPALPKAHFHLCFLDSEWCICPPEQELHFHAGTRTMLQFYRPLHTRR